MLYHTPVITLAFITTVGILNYVQITVAPSVQDMNTCYIMLYHGICGGISDLCTIFHVQECFTEINYRVQGLSSFYTDTGIHKVCACSITVVHEQWMQTHPHHTV